QARELRRQIAALPTTQAGLAEKQRLLAEAHQVVHRSQGYADLVAGGWLAATLPGREKATAVAERIAELTRKIADGADPSILEEQAQAWLRLDLPTNAFDRKPLLSVVGQTAYHALRTLRVGTGETLLVHGAAG